MSASSAPPARGEQGLLASDADRFFTEPHDDGLPAVIIRLLAVDVAELDRG